MGGCVATIGRVIPVAILHSRPLRPSPRNPAALRSEFVARSAPSAAAAGSEDMETATVFVVAFANRIPAGALLLVSDQPMVPEGVKTEDSDRKVTEEFVDEHLRIGIDSLRQLINRGHTVKHLRF